MFVRESGGQVFSRMRGLGLPSREIDLRETQRRLTASRFPVRRVSAPNEARVTPSTDSELLVQVPDLPGASSFTAPLSDGRTQIGLL